MQLGKRTHDQADLGIEDLTADFTKDTAPAQKDNDMEETGNTDEVEYNA